MTAMREGRSGLRLNDLEDVDLKTWIGRVAELESMPITRALSPYDGRTNRLALLGLRQDGFEDAVATARERYGAERIAVVIGTTTSGIQQTELAFRQRDAATRALPAWFHYRETHNVFSVGDFVQQWLGLRGPAAADSTARSASGQALASHPRLVESQGVRKRTSFDRRGICRRRGGGRCGQPLSYDALRLQFIGTLVVRAMPALRRVA